MAGQEPSRLRSHIRRDLVEADLDTAFALLYFAETQSIAGSHDEAYRALEEADAACSDGQRRLHVLDLDGHQSFSPQLQRMRDVIHGMKSRLRAA